MERQQYFKKNSISFDEFEYCDPQFVNGNCLQLVPDGHLYDRVYCGAACPPEHENYMKNLVRVGGVLVMPLNDQVNLSLYISSKLCSLTYCQSDDCDFNHVVTVCYPIHSLGDTISTPKYCCCD